MRNYVKYIALAFFLAMVNNLFSQGSDIVITNEYTYTLSPNTIKIIDNRPNQLFIGTILEENNYTKTLAIDLGEIETIDLSYSKTKALIIDLPYSNIKTLIKDQMIPNYSDNIDPIHIYRNKEYAIISIGNWAFYPNYGYMALMPYIEKLNTLGDDILKKEIKSYKLELNTSKSIAFISASLGILTMGYGAYELTGDSSPNVNSAITALGIGSLFLIPEIIFMKKTTKPPQKVVDRFNLVYSGGKVVDQYDRFYNGGEIFLHSEYKPEGGGFHRDPPRLRWVVP